MMPIRRTSPYSCLILALFRAVTLPLTRWAARFPLSAFTLAVSPNSADVNQSHFTAMSIAVPNYNQYLGDSLSSSAGGAGSPTSSLSVLGGGASGWGNQYDSNAQQQQQDGRPPNKRRLSDGELESCSVSGWPRAS